MSRRRSSGARLGDRGAAVQVDHIWNLADIKTSQGVLRAFSMNHKGVLDRDRRPNLTAHRVWSLWAGDDSAR